MTRRLFDRFMNKYPPINDYYRVSTYQYSERIYLDLMGREFLDAKFINPQEEIKELALRIFDVNFKYKNLDDEGNSRLAIIFSPIILPRGKMSYSSFTYQNRYDGHSIDIFLPANHPMITISTGNRGRADLLKKQRDLYYNFVDSIYNLFIEKTKS